jgi:hypothetical protein
VLGAGLEPACLSAYAPQTYVSAIPPPERLNLGTARQNLPQAMRCGKRPFGALVSLELPLVIVSETESSIAMSTRARDVKFAQYAVKLPDAVDRAE